MTSNDTLSALIGMVFPPSSTSSCYSELNNYTCSGKGLLLPLISEYTWPLQVRAFLYLVGMLWCFLGIAIIADIFMCAIEKITSNTRIVKVASSDPETIGYEEVEVKVKHLSPIVNYSMFCVEGFKVTIRFAVYYGPVVAFLTLFL